MLFHLYYSGTELPEGFVPQEFRVAGAEFGIEHAALQMFVIGAPQGHKDP